MHGFAGRDEAERPVQISETVRGTKKDAQRVAAAGDNACMESFHSLSQDNVRGTKRWETREDLRVEIVTWIQRADHRRRRKRSLGQMTSVEFEAVIQAVDEVEVAA